MIAQIVLADFLVLHQATMEQLKDAGDVAPLEKAEAISRLSDAFHKTMAAVAKTIVPKQAGALHFKLPGNLGWVTRQSVTIPKRPFLGIDDDDQAEIVAQAEDWLAVAEAQP
jgi:phage gpG-like protein